MSDLKVSKCNKCGCEWTTNETLPCPECPMDYKKMFEMKQNDWLEVCKEYDTLLKERDGLLGREIELLRDYQKYSLENTKLKAELDSQQKENHDLREALHELNSKLSTQSQAAGKLLDVLEHALALGHLGDGSTKGWAIETIKAYKQND